MEGKIERGRDSHARLKINQGKIWKERLRGGGYTINRKTSKRSKYEGRSEGVKKDTIMSLKVVFKEGKDQKGESTYMIKRKTSKTGKYEGRSGGVKKHTSVSLKVVFKEDVKGK